MVSEGWFQNLYDVDVFLSSGCWDLRTKQERSLVYQNIKYAFVVEDLLLQA